MEISDSFSSSAMRPLIIANGFFPFPIPLLQIATIYRIHGFTVCVIPFDIRNKVNVCTYAETIEKCVNSVNQKTGKSIDMVGLSMGGVSALMALKNLGCASKIRTLAAVGSPFNGSPLAYLGYAYPLFRLTAEQLSPGSKLLDDLKKAEPAEGARIISIGGYLDVVSPISSTWLDEAKNYRWFFGHHDLVLPCWLHFEVAKLLL